MQFAYCARIVCKFTDRAALFASFQVTATVILFIFAAGVSGSIVVVRLKFIPPTPILTVSAEEGNLVSVALT
jgi:hypothetical protein